MMISFPHKTWPFISLALVLTLIASLLFYPEISGWVSIFLIFGSLGMALYVTIEKHIQPYKQGQITRLRFTRNILLDLLGMFLAIAAASYLGSLAGIWLGKNFGLWVGLFAGIVIAFLAAWSVRKVWGRLVRTR